MPIWLIEPPVYREPLGEWPLPPEPRLMHSKDAGRLRADIARYVRGLVRGRSYLIAGHRGVGKTSLSVHAVESIATEILSRSVRLPDDLPDGPLQRPLLVKLEGPSMLEKQQIPPPPGPPAPSRPVPAPPSADRLAAGLAAQDGTGGDPVDGTVTAGAHAALVQITIGLYRALAGEAAMGYRAHALHLRGRPPRDHSERAAQLALDLDSGADISRLRGYWSGLGRLARGVFWPVAADEACEAHGMHDQGEREIIALATAAQAFQVCTGRISSTTLSRDALDRIQTTELRGSSDLREAISRLATLGIGALTGVSILGTTDAHPGVAITGGLAVWLFGTLSLSWSDIRTLTSNKSIDYSFIRDFSLATLGRDLPVVISRIREAGLVPVFIIDELDKVEHASDALGDLVGKIKHLIADYGFFCFLVNRDCYELIETRIRSLSYPSEHTLFSERLLLRPDPDYMRAYLLGLIEYDEAEVLAGQARATFALVAMHETRLNLTDLTRYLGRYSRGPGELLGEVGELTSQRKSILATVQLAIEQLLKSPLLAGHMAEDPIFAQLALDTLYYPSRQWKQGVLALKSGRDDLRDHLVERMRQELSKPVAEASGASPGDNPFPLTDDELNRLHKALIELLRLLADLPRLCTGLDDRNASGETGDPEAGDVRLVDIVPSDVDAICRETRGQFEFLYTYEGEKADANGVLSQALRTRIRFLVDYCRELQGLVERCGTNLDELSVTPLLSSVDSVVIASAFAALEIALDTGEIDIDTLQHLSVLEGLYKNVVGRADKIATLLTIVASLRREGQRSAPVLPRVARLIRFTLRPQQWFKGHENFRVSALPADVEMLREWDEREPSYPAGGARTRSAYSAYQYLIEPFTRYFEGGKQKYFTPDFGTLLDASRNRMPGAALCADLSRMTARDWSELALATLPSTRRGREPAPYWMLIAALRGLGFDRAVLEMLAEPGPELIVSLLGTGWFIESKELTRTECLAIAREMARDAPQRRGGILIFEDGDRFGEGRPDPSVPALVVDIRSSADYLPFLQWLIEFGIFESVANWPLQMETGK